MHGNVWEWVQDRYGDYPSGSVTDSQGSSSGSYRVVRGGSWNSDAGYLRSANSYTVTPDHRYSDLGFRLAGSEFGGLNKTELYFERVNFSFFPFYPPFGKGGWGDFPEIEK